MERIQAVLPLMEEDYEYKTVFNYEETQFKDCQEVILRFDGIDTQ